jgi:hypothetical protein
MVMVLAARQAKRPKLGLDDGLPRWTPWKKTTTGGPGRHRAKQATPAARGTKNRRLTSMRAPTDTVPDVSVTCRQRRSRYAAVFERCSTAVGLIDADKLEAIAADAQTWCRSPAISATISAPDLEAERIVNLVSLYLGAAPAAVTWTRAARGRLWAEGWARICSRPCVAMPRSNTSAIGKCQPAALRR